MNLQSMNATINTKSSLIDHWYFSVW